MLRHMVGRLVVLGLVVALFGLSGCGANGTGDKGYVDGNGVITRLAADHRTEVGKVSGTTLDGKQVDLSAYRGKIVVVNVWGTWCPPCRAEATRLGDAARQLSDNGVVFLGINTRDASPDQGRAFQRRHHLDYPSIFDPGGQTLLAFRGAITPSAIPSTVVVDQRGRVAASIIGEVTSATTLVDLVQDVAA